MKPLLAAATDPTEEPGLFSAVFTQYSQGNIVVIPKDLMTQFAISKGINSL